MSNSASSIYIDGHCHLHNGLSPELFLNTAVRNFREHSKQTIPGGQLRAFLCLADFRGAEGFSKLQQYSGTKELNGWSAIETGEAEISKLFKSPDGDRIWVIAGHQTVTCENIEVVALGSGEKPEDGHSLIETVDGILDAGAFPVIPWGVGKWWGKRGRTVQSAIKRFGRKVALGDNGGRPWFWHPRLIASARTKNNLVIPGGDPLRLKKDRLRNGAFGMRLTGPMDYDKPAAWLLKQLATLGHDTEFFGKPSGVFRFFDNQIALRLTR